MRRIMVRNCVLMCGLGIVANMVIAIILGGGCLPETKTILCEGSDLRCRPGQVCAADGGCVDVGGCGDGQVDIREECDDGNLEDGDGCDSNCILNRCGNGIRMASEQCDDGLFNSDSGACLANCMIARCGDGHVRTGVEECDFSSFNSDSGECLENCMLATCGDGYVRAGVEMCDDGNNDGCGTCNVSCSATKAGGDCPAGFGCVFNADCASNICSSNHICL